MLSHESIEIRKTIKKGSVFTLIPPSIKRKAWEKIMLTIPLPENIIIEKKSIHNIPTEWISNKNNTNEKIIIHLHGGGFTSGSCITHREFASKIVNASGKTVILIDYSLAPEHPFPAALNECVLIYNWLISEYTKAENIIIGGDSAGGGLTLSMLLTFKEQSLPMPYCTYLISPWVDLTLSGESYTTRRKNDPMIIKIGLKKDVKYYLKNSNAKDPLVSPIFGNLTGLPPMLIHVGKDEILLSDSIQLAEKAKAEGVKVKLEVWEDLWHVFHAYPIPEANEAIKNIAHFIDNIPS